jgi:hypothetical protein
MLNAAENPFTFVLSDRKRKEGAGQYIQSVCM